jgi:AraC-like DNA-binding protein
MQETESGLLFRVPKMLDESFSVQLEEGERFYPIRHYHPEVQLTLIIEGRGTRFIGNSIASFREGDVFLIGSNVPHVFRNDQPGSSGERKVSSLSVYFKPDVLGDTFFSLPETRHISVLLSEASKGIEILGGGKDKLCDHLQRVRQSRGFNRLVELLEILNLISLSKDYRIISQLSYTRPVRDADNRRISSVFDFVVGNYTEEISLDRAASIANMSTTAFCRYFKLHTRQTFTEFLNRTRIGQASRVLIDTNQSVSEIGYSCGYNNIPYFTRQFRKFTGITPLAYRRQYRVLDQ